MLIQTELINRGTESLSIMFALLTRIQETLSPEAGDPNTFFLVFLRISRKIHGQYLETGHDILFQIRSYTPSLLPIKFVAKQLLHVEQLY